MQFSELLFCLVVWEMESFYCFGCAILIEFWQLLKLSESHPTHGASTFVPDCTIVTAIPAESQWRMGRSWPYCTVATHHGSCLLTLCHCSVSCRHTHRYLDVILVQLVTVCRVTLDLHRFKREQDLALRISLPLSVKWVYLGSCEH